MIALHPLGFESRADLVFFSVSEIEFPGNMNSRTIVCRIT